MRNVEGGRHLPLLRVEWIPRRSQRHWPRRARNEAACNRADIVEGFRPCITRLQARAAMCDRPLQRSLQCVITRVRVRLDKLLRTETARNCSRAIEFRVAREVFVGARVSIRKARTG